MKKVILTIFCFIFAVGIFAEEPSADQEAIKEVIHTAYIEGIHNIGDLEKIDQGFHPGFVLVGINKDNSMWKYPIYSWKEGITKKLKEETLPKSEEDLIVCKYPMIDVTGNAAIAKIELYQNEELIYTDYLSLYKIDNNWKIVNKIYSSHKK